MVRGRPRNRRAAYGLLIACAASVVLIAGVASAARHGRAGSLDRGFGRGGIATLGAGTRLFGIAVQRDGKVVAVGEAGAGSSADLLLARLTGSGRLDRSFGRGGVVRGPRLTAGFDKNSIGRAVAIQPDGKLVVVGSATDRTGAFEDGLLVERYSANGRLDRSFASGGVADLLAGSSFGEGHAVAIQRDGKIVATGSATATGSGGTQPRVAVARLKPNGRVDPSFKGRGLDVIDLGAFSIALGVAPQRNGKIVIAGSQAPRLQVTNALIARLTPSGALDRSFASGGSYAHQYARGAAFSSFDGVAVRGNGSVVAVGPATHGNSAADTILVRFSPSGHPAGVTYRPSATNFTESSSSSVPGAHGVALAPGGGVFAAGEIATGAETTLAVWAFTPGGRPAGGFGSRGVAITPLGSGEIGEGAAVAAAPGGKLVVAGDGQVPAATSYKGVVARYNG
jgi:uncharacterized delta-60 repeat protein